MSNPAFINKHKRSETAFTRKRSLDFRTLVLLMLNFRKNSTRIELDAFAESLLPDNPSFVTPSAFTQAREKLSETAFIELNHHVNNMLFKERSFLKTWQGHRVCAIDGSSIRLPNTPEIVEHFGVKKGRANQADCPLGMVSVFYDVLNKIVIDSEVQPAHYSERLCAKSHLAYAQPTDLVLYDRGYNAFWLYAYHQQAQQPFCMRLRTNQLKEAKTFIASGKKQAIVQLHSNVPSTKTCEQMNLPTSPVKLRLVRVELPSEVEVLITNLMDEEAYPAHIFKSLYHLRWGVEENYKRLKQWLEIENYSGRSALAIKQDFYAKILVHNLMVMLSWLAQQDIDQQTKHRKHRYQINLAYAASKAKNRLIELLMFAQKDAKNWHHLLQKLINLMSSSSEAVREGRSFLRKMKNIKNDIHYQAYKNAL